MKNVFKVLALGAAIAASATIAKADNIDAGFIVNSNSTSDFSYGSSFIEFGNTAANAVGTVTLGVGDQGKLFNSATVDFYVGAIAIGTSGSTFTVPGSTATTGGLKAASANNGTDTITFYLTSLSPIYNSTNKDLTLTGTGYFTDSASGLVATAGTFNLAADTNSAGTMTLESFSVTSGTVAPTPEPSSLALLGSSLLGAAGIARRRFLRK